MAAAQNTSRSTASVTSSNFRDRTAGLRTSITAPTAANFNQTADPLLGWGSDFSLRPQAGSPLIDRGSVLAVGATSEDLGADPTPRGSARDIGAYEYDSALPPTAPGATMTPPTNAGLPAPAPVATMQATGTEATGGVAQAGVFSVGRPRLVVQRSAIRVRTAAAAPSAGVVTQRITIGRGPRLRVLCTARATTAAAGSVSLTCTMRRAARNLLRRTTQRYTVRTVFTEGGDRMVNAQRLTVKRRR